MGELGYLSGEVISRKRVGVVLTKPYLDALEKLVGAGVYASRREIFTDALRQLFRHYGIEPFCAEEPEEAKNAERPK